jgi:hypothetical protein
MTAAIKYLSEMTETIFASQMRRAAVKIAAREHMFARR